MKLIITERTPRLTPIEEHHHYDGTISLLRLDGYVEKTESVKLVGSGRFSYFLNEWTHDKFEFGPCTDC